MALILISGKKRMCAGRYHCPSTCKESYLRLLLKILSFYKIQDTLVATTPWHTMGKVPNERRLPPVVTQRVAARVRETESWSSCLSLERRMGLTRFPELPVEWLHCKFSWALGHSHLVFYTQGNCAGCLMVPELSTESGWGKDLKSGFQEEELISSYLET